MAPSSSRRSVVVALMLIPAVFLVIYGGWLVIGSEPVPAQVDSSVPFRSSLRIVHSNRGDETLDARDFSGNHPPAKSRRRSSLTDHDGEALPADQNIAVDAPSSSAPPLRCLDEDYHSWFTGILYDNFGRVIAEAVYHPELFNVMVNTLEDHGSDTYKWPNDDDFIIGDINAHPTKPGPFQTPANMLWWAKRWITVALSKISRDAELQKLFVRICSDPSHEVKMALLEKTTVQAMSAQIQYFHTVMQLIIDVNLSPSTKRTFTDLVKAHPGMDVLVLVSGWVTPSTTIADLEQLFSSESAMAAVVRGRLAAVQNEPVKNSQSLFPMNYDDRAYHDSMPFNGKFWTMLRPTAGCASLIRICENAEGCRLLCNAEYILYAGRRGSKRHQSAQVEGGSPPLSLFPPYHHRIVGMGCNNEYDWELSFLALFGGSTALSQDKTHRIGWLTSMDCTITIGPGRRQWKVPHALQEATIGYSGASVCGAARNNGNNELGPKGLKAFQLATEASWGKSTDQPIVRFKAHPEAIAASQRRAADDTEDKEFTMSPRSFQGKPLVSPRWFDALTMFKVDIEGSEWKYIPAWIRGELHNIRTHAPSQTFAQGSTVAIDYASAARDFFTVSLFSLEFHRIGMGEPPGYTPAGALRAHWLSLQTYGLGFIMVAHEKNEWGHCCYENTYVHVRHFIKSEMWMALRDDM